EHFQGHGRFAGGLQLFAEVVGGGQRLVGERQQDVILLQSRLGAGAVAPQRGDQHTLPGGDTELRPQRFTDRPQRRAEQLVSLIDDMGDEEIFQRRGIWREGAVLVGDQLDWLSVIIHVYIPDRTRCDGGPEHIPGRRLFHPRPTSTTTGGGCRGNHRR